MRRSCSAEDLKALLGDPGCPWATVLRSHDERAVRVEDLLLFARSRGLSTTGLEARMDRFVRSIGGRRDQVLDPWSALSNLLRRLTGRLPSPPLELWWVPERFLEESRSGNQA